MVVSNLIDDVIRMLYRTDAFYPLIFLAHYLCFQLLIVSKFYDKIKQRHFYRKVLLYNLLIVYEIAYTVLLTVFCLPPTLRFLFYNELNLSKTHVVIVYLSGVQFWTLYGFEMALNYRDPFHQLQQRRIPQLTIHHLISLTNNAITNILLRLSPDHDTTVKMIIFYGMSIAMYHASIDFIMHIPLLLWRINVCYRIRSLLFWFSSWPLLVIRSVINIFVIAIYVAAYCRNFPFSAYCHVWVWSHILTLIAFNYTQIIGSRLMIHIRSRDSNEHNEQPLMKSGSDVELYDTFPSSNKEDQVSD